MLTKLTSCFSRLMTHSWMTQTHTHHQDARRQQDTSHDNILAFFPTKYLIDSHARSTINFARSFRNTHQSILLCVRKHARRRWLRCWIRLTRKASILTTLSLIALLPWKIWKSKHGNVFPVHEPSNDVVRMLEQVSKVKGSVINWTTGVCWTI